MGSTDANPHPVLKLIPAHPDAPSATRTARAGAAKRRSVIEVLLLRRCPAVDPGSPACKVPASGAGRPLRSVGERPTGTGLDTPPGRIPLYRIRKKNGSHAESAEVAEFSRAVSSTL